MASKTPFTARRGRSGRPVLHLPPGPIELLLIILAIVGLFVLVGITVWGWSTAQAIIPMHFNALGQADSYGGKGFLVTLPVIGLLVTILLFVLARYPHTYNYPWPITQENAARQYRLARILLRWLNALMGWLFVLIQWSIIHSALSQPGPGASNFAILGGIGLILLSVAGYIIIAARQR